MVRMILLLDEIICEPPHFSILLGCKPKVFSSIYLLILYLILRLFLLVSYAGRSVSVGGCQP